MEHYMEYIRNSEGMIESIRFSYMYFTQHDVLYILNKIEDQMNYCINEYGVYTIVDAIELIETITMMNNITETIMYKFLKYGFTKENEDDVRITILKEKDYMEIKFIGFSLIEA